MAKNIITDILGHDVSWYVQASKVTELDADTRQHIIDLIMDDYSSGEICMTLKNGKETTGWWHIINWRDIALELRNSIVNVMDSVKPKYQKKAVKRFDKEWTF